MSLAALDPSRLRALLAADARSIRRDPVLYLVVVMAFLPAIVFGIWRAPIDAFLLARTGFAEFTGAVLGFLLVLPAGLLGWVSGMLLLEDRDEGTLTALDVTPVGKGGVLFYRAGLAAVTSFALGTAAIALLSPLPPGPALGLAALLGLESAGVVVFTLAAAGNKVEGLALSKFLNLFALGALIALLPGMWRFAASPLPSFWVGEILFNAPGPLLWSLAGAVHLITLICLARWAARRAA
jgi:hypothetical protein